MSIFMDLSPNLWTFVYLLVLLIIESIRWIIILVIDGGESMGEEK